MQPKKKQGNPNMKKGVYPEHLKGKGFDARPENINKKGARRSIGSIINDMKKDDVSVLDKKTLMELYKILFNATGKELMKLKNHDDTPVGIVIIIATLQDPKTRAKAWTDYTTWVFGKAPEAGDMKKAQEDVDFENMTPEVKKAYEVILKKVADDY